MPEDVALQTRNALEKVAMILHAADVTMEAVVEVTSYHIGLRDHFDEVGSIFHELFGTPLPAWTAVEAAGLRRPLAVIELRIVAHAPLTA